MPFTTDCRVEFADTDMAGITHFASFYRFMEVAEHAFLRHVGINVVEIVANKQISWPRVASSCEYSAPAHFGDVLTITVTIDKIGEKSITYRFEFDRQGAPIAIGQMTAVCCEIGNQDKPKSVAIPDSIRQRLSQLQ